MFWLLMVVSVGCLLGAVGYVLLLARRNGGPIDATFRQVWPTWVLLLVAGACTLVATQKFGR